MAKKKVFYKVLNSRYEGPYSCVRWLKPSCGYNQPNDLWVTVLGGLEMCSNGLHLIKNVKDIKSWRGFDPGYRLFVAEVPPGTKVINGEGKVLVKTARLVREIKPKSKEWFTLYEQSNGLKHFEDPTRKLLKK